MATAGSEQFLRLDYQRLRLSAARRHLAPLMALVTMLVGLAAQAGSKNVVAKVEVNGVGENRTIRIHTSSTPTFTVFRLANPMRVVVDISGGGQ